MVLLGHLPLPSLLQSAGQQSLLLIHYSLFDTYSVKYFRPPIDCWYLGPIPSRSLWLFYAACYAQHCLQRGHALYLRPVVSPDVGSVSTSARAALAIGQHAGRRQVALAVISSRPACCPCWRFLCQRGLACLRVNPFPCNNGIVHRAGKSIIQMLLWGHHRTANGLQLSDFGFLMLVGFLSFSLIFI